MIKYILKRLILLIPLLFGITLFAFFLLNALPGDPVLGLVGERANPDVIEGIRKEIGMDKGFIRQYIGYLKLLSHGDFGRSYYTNREVLTDIAMKFPNTMRLAFASMFIAVPSGIVLGFISAYKRGRFIDRFINMVSIASLSIPVFWSAIIIMLFLSLKLKLFPPSGTGDIRFLALPAFVLSIPAMATLSRVTRTAVLDILKMPYINTARAKGLPLIKISFVHVLKNAIIPIITIIGLDFGSYLNGAVVTETIFGWDGIGRFTMDGIIKRDYPVIMGCIIFGTVVFVFVNLITDIIYHYLDPRIRLHEKSE
ncbi:peptide ABC transporter permease [Dissulfurispira thermophila]|uniref:Peptide ABC transporter permease n=2 Tax=root TaxID=1 RepID=A0A7G1H3H9_9BACT|nr:ABC transporter permease [Dissulfurispira thermophila]BCB96496.1 peptide ABC transporter permease [Dissulfurispira thermophila]